MGNQLQSESQQDAMTTPSQQLLLDTVGVTEIQRAKQVSQQVQNGLEVDRRVVTGGLMITERETKLLWKEYDKDKNGVLDTFEAHRFLRDLLNTLEKRELQNAKNQLETLVFKKDMYKRNGWNFEKAREDATNLHKHIPAIFKAFQNNVQYLIEELDQNKDGTISLVEFLSFCRTFNVHEQRKKLYGLLPGEE
jgi:Ca2+-binding EF-hand superfamily protein